MGRLQIHCIGHSRSTSSNEELKHDFHCSNGPLWKAHKSKPHVLVEGYAYISTFCPSLSRIVRNNRLSPHKQWPSICDIGFREALGTSRREAHEAHKVTSSDEGTTPEIQQGSSRAHTALRSGAPGYLGYICIALVLGVVLSPALIHWGSVFSFLRACRPPEAAITYFPSAVPADPLENLSPRIFYDRLLSILVCTGKKVDSRLIAAQKSYKYDYAEW